MRWLFLCFVGAGLVGAQEGPADPFGDNPPPLGVGLISQPGRLTGIDAKLRSIRIPLIDFADTPLDVALEFLRVQAEEHDFSAVDPAARGINIVTRIPSGWPGPKVSLGDDKPFAFSMDDSPRVTLEMKNAPLLVAIRYVAESVGLEMHVEPDAVILMPPGDGNVANVVTKLEEVGPTVEAWNDGTLRAGGSEVFFPNTSLLEALQIEYRKLKRLKERIRNVEEREEVERRLEVTDQAIEKARKLLLDYWEAERALGEAWQAETGN